MIRSTFSNVHLGATPLSRPTPKFAGQVKCTAQPVPNDIQTMIDTYLPLIEPDQDPATSSYASNTLLRDMKDAFAAYGHHPEFQNALRYFDSQVQKLSTPKQNGNPITVDELQKDLNWSAQGLWSQLFSDILTKVLNKPAMAMTSIIGEKKAPALVKHIMVRRAAAPGGETALPA